MQLRPYQTKAIDELAIKASQGKKRLCLQLATGGGKCLGKDTPVLMHDGRFKMVQDIKTGDKLMGVDSHPRTVLSTCTGQDEMFKINQVKGDSFICNAPHVLSLVSNTTKYGLVKDQVINIPLNEYLALPKHVKHLLKLYKSEGIDFPEYQTFLDPYFLGIWLGDGNSRGVVITNMDQEVADYLNGYCAKIKHTLTEKPNGDTKAKQYHIGTDGAHYGIRSYLKRSRLLQNKHIPKEYLFNSRAVRMELLAGIIDTDGYLHHNGYEVFTVSERLKDDIVFLTRSLGFFTKFSTRKGVKGYRITFYGEGLENVPVRIERKKASKRLQIKNALRTGFTVEPLGVGDYYGFELDGDHLFMLGDLTVTHNTVMFSGLIARYLQRQQKKVLILVHREELLKQARKTLYEWYGIIAAPIVPGVRDLPSAHVYVAMVETANNRLRKQPNYFGEVGLVIIDEAHLGNFRKLLTHFPCLTIGFTATPISSKPKEPLNGIYEDIVCGIDIPELISSGSLAPNKTYHVKNINRATLSISKGEFDDKAMGIAYSRPKQVHNTVDCYMKHALNKKTLVFNCNVEHSKLVTAAFIEAGFDARHLDANSADRASTIEWFKNTPGAILNNVGILTAGFDEPSVECVIMNKATLSLPLWLQCTGRGSRPHQGKTHFTILDLGGNALSHGDWSTSRDWADLFHNPPAPGKGDGVAPVKECGRCGGIIQANLRSCPLCGHELPASLKIDSEPLVLELLQHSDIQVSQIVQDNAQHKDYRALHVIKSKLVNEAKARGLSSLNEDTARQLATLYQSKVKEWCKVKRKRYNEWHRKTTAEWFSDELKRVYKYEANAI